MRKFIFFVLFAGIGIVCINSCKKNLAPVPATEFAITASSGPNGEVTPSGKQVYSAGAEAQYVVTPTAGYNIATLVVDGVAVTPATSYTFSNIRANHTISATFSLEPVVTAVTGPNGTVSLASQAVTPGGSATFTFTPAESFHTDSLFVDDVFVKVLNGSTTYTLTNVTANHSIKVTFSDALPQVKLDSLKNLLVGSWHYIQAELAQVGPNGPDNYQPINILPCEADDYEVYSANYAYASYLNNTACNTPGPTIVDFRGTWALSQNAKLITYIGNRYTDNVTYSSYTGTANVLKLTTDSLVVIIPLANSSTKVVRYHYVH